MFLRSVELLRRSPRLSPPVCGRRPPPPPLLCHALSHTLSRSHLHCLHYFVHVFILSPSIHHSCIPPSFHPPTPPIKPTHQSIPQTAVIDYVDDRAAMPTRATNSHASKTPRTNFLRHQELHLIPSWRSSTCESPWVSRKYVLMQSICVCRFVTYFCCSPLNSHEGWSAGSLLVVGDLCVLPLI